MNQLDLIRGCGVLVTALALTACSSMDKQTAMTTAPSADSSMAQLDQRQQELRRQQAELDSMRTQLQQRQAQLDTRARQLEQPAPAQQTAMAGDSLLPPGSEAGHCFARVFVPPKYETVTERVLVSEASERIEVIPARYEMVEEKVLVAEASERLETIPATYKWVEEQMMVKPASSRMVEIPATYKTVSEQVLVQPAHTVWKKGTGPIQRIDEATGEIMCLVEVPAQYRTVTTRVVDKPATTRLVEEPAMYNTVKKQVIDQPASTRRIEIPAKYKTVKVQKLVSPAQERRIEIPASYDTVTKTKKVAEGHMAWREILCDTNMTRGRITQIQTALQSKGYNPGPIDGVIGRQTMQAVNEYQRAEGLPVDNYLNIKTVKALGVLPK